MYLTDYRERSLKDVITQLEPGLFKKVTGLDVKDFELLVSLNVFNGALMNDAIFKFKRYEDASLSYTGIDKHSGEDIGGWDTVVKREEYESLFYSQQDTMLALDVPADKDKESYIAYIKDAVADVPMAAEEVKLDIGTESSTEKEGPKTVFSKVAVGTEVEHKKFGRGEVTNIDDLITVRFSNGEKKFSYPSAFEDGFLSLI